MSKEAVIVASSRVGLAKSFRGSFNMTRPDDLAAHCIRDVLAKVPSLNAAQLEDVFLGCANPEGVHGANMARMAAIVAGLPVSVGGTTVNRFCWNTIMPKSWTLRGKLFSGGLLRLVVNPMKWELAMYTPYQNC